MVRHGCLDEVSGLPKRESMLSYLRGQLNLLEAHGLPLSTALIQLDRMQLFQDAHGQEAVRSITQVVAHTMREVLRSTTSWADGKKTSFWPFFPAAATVLLRKLLCWLPARQ